MNPTSLNVIMESCVFWIVVPTKTCAHRTICLIVFLRWTMNTLLRTIKSHISFPSRHFWVDEFRAFPFGGICFLVPWRVFPSDLVFMVNFEIYLLLMEILSWRILFVFFFQTEIGKPLHTGAGFVQNNAWSTTTTTTTTAAATTTTTAKARTIRTATRRQDEKKAPKIR